MIWFICSKDHIPEKDKMIRVECTIDKDPYHFTGYIVKTPIDEWFPEFTELAIKVTNELTGTYKDKHDNVISWENFCETGKAQWRYVTDNEKMAFL